MKALKWCANGCGVPPKPPSKVICGECTAKIFKNLESMIEQLKDEAQTPFYKKEERLGGKEET